MPVSNFSQEDYLLMATREGIIKKTPLGQFQEVRSSGLIAMKMKVCMAILQIHVRAFQPVSVCRDASQASHVVMLTQAAFLESWQSLDIQCVSLLVILRSCSQVIPSEACFKSSTFLHALHLQEDFVASLRA